MYAILFPGSIAIYAPWKLTDFVKVSNTFAKTIQRHFLKTKLVPALFVRSDLPEWTISKITSTVMSIEYVQVVKVTIDHNG